MSSLLMPFISVFIPFKNICKGLTSEKIDFLKVESMIQITSIKS